MQYICWLKEEGKWTDLLDGDEVIDEYEGRGCPEGFVVLDPHSDEERDKYNQEGAAVFEITKRAEFRDYFERKEALGKEDQLQDRLDRDAQDDDDDDGADAFRPFDARTYTSNVKRELNELWKYQLESIMRRMRGEKPLQDTE